MAPFDPIGDRSRWCIAYDLLRAAAVDDVVTYGELGAALGLDPDEDRHVIQMAMRRAAREHEEVDKRAVEAVTNRGYRIIPAPENLRLARGQQQKAGRSLERGRSKVVNVDLAGLDPEVRKAFEVVAVAFQWQVDQVRRLDIRQSRLEETIASMTTRTERTEDEINELKARLARLEHQDEP
jgi:hypothetical protein